MMKLWVYGKQASYIISYDPGSVFPQCGAYMLSTEARGFYGRVFNRLPV